MRLSVLMGVFNGEAFLAEAMDSVLAQTFRDFELIVVDDGSTDGSPKLLADYAKRDARVKILNQKNAGLTAALNAAAKASTAPLLARMDPDDMALPTRFQQQVAYMDAHPEVTLLGTRVILVDPYGTAFKWPLHPLTHEEIDSKLMEGEGWAIVHPAAMMRRDAFERVGGYDERYRTSQDFDLWLRMAETGRLANLEEPLLKYRQHLASANFAKAEQQKKLKVQILSEAHTRRGLPPFDPATLPPPPISDPYESRRRWGWAAVREKNFTAARKHAWQNIKARPTAVEMWKLLFCSVRGY
ncbi:MAG: glycosyl transferase family 2 [Phycisphaerales bacterium]|nr:glycosyl transferase family 2 [Phycisphaerales bacterium]